MSTLNQIEFVSIQGLYGHKNLAFAMSKTPVTIIYGKNNTYKTSLLIAIADSLLNNSESTLPVTATTIVFANASIRYWNGTCNRIIDNQSNNFDGLTFIRPNTVRLVDLAGINVGTADKTRVDCFVKIALKFMPDTHFVSNGKWVLDIESLSGGEQSLLAILYALIFESTKGGLVLIDCPETNLHAYWQQVLTPVIERLAKQFGYQVIMTTRSKHIIECYADQKAIVRL